MAKLAATWTMGTMIAFVAALTPAAEPVRSSTVRLKDGREIGIFECGDPDGNTTVFYFHGLPSCRLEAAFLDKPGRDEGIRIISIDRPGLGLSDFTDREILNWPADFAQIVAILSLEPRHFINANNRLNEFGILAVSSGAPFAAACALASEDREAGALAGLASVSIVNGVAPPEAVDNGHAAQAFAKAARRPEFSRLTLRMASRGLSRRPQETFHRLTSEMARQDLDFLADSLNRNRFIASIQEALRSGPQGVVYEAQLLSRSWGFHLYDIKRKVRFYYADSDRTTPPTIVDFLQRDGIPSSQITILPNQGHVSIFAWDNPANRPLKAVLDEMKQEGRAVSVRTTESRSHGSGHQSPQLWANSSSWHLTYLACAAACPFLTWPFEIFLSN